MSELLGVPETTQTLVGDELHGEPPKCAIRENELGTFQWKVDNVWYLTTDRTSNLVHLFYRQGVLHFNEGVQSADYKLKRRAFEQAAAHFYLIVEKLFPRWKAGCREHVNVTTCAIEVPTYLKAETFESLGLYSLAQAYKVVVERAKCEQMDCTELAKFGYELLTSMVMKNAFIQAGTYSYVEKLRDWFLEETMLGYVQGLEVDGFLGVHMPVLLKCNQTFRWNNDKITKENALLYHALPSTQPWEVILEDLGLESDDSVFPEVIAQVAPTVFGPYPLTKTFVMRRR